jgi:hypothetical protein
MGGVVGSFIVLVCVSICMQWAVMITGARKIWSLKTELLASIPEQEAAVMQTRLGFVVTSWTTFPILFIILSAYFESSTGLEYAFTLFDVLLGVILFWYLITQILIQRRSSEGDSKGSFKPSKNKYTFGEETTLSDETTIRMNREYSRVDSNGKFISPGRGDTNQSSFAAKVSSRVSVGSEFDDLIYALQNEDEELQVTPSKSRGHANRSATQRRRRSPNLMTRKKATSS